MRACTKHTWTSINKRNRDRGRGGREGEREMETEGEGEGKVREKWRQRQMEWERRKTSAAGAKRGKDNQKDRLVYIDRPCLEQCRWLPCWQGILWVRTWVCFGCRQPARCCSGPLPEAHLKYNIHVQRFPRCAKHIFTCWVAVNFYISSMTKQFLK